MSDQSDNTCHYCGTSEEELRPYGPGGSWVCWECAMATPERKTQTEQAFGALLDAAGSVSDVVAIGQPSGPTSVQHAIQQTKETS